jgi:hypothetical protein
MKTVKAHAAKTLLRDASMEPYPKDTETVCEPDMRRALLLASIEPHPLKYGNAPDYGLITSGTTASTGSFLTYLDYRHP